MARANVNEKIEKIERIVVEEKKVKEIVLTLTEEEAKFIYTLSGKTIGGRFNSANCSIYNVLRDVLGGYECNSYKQYIHPQTHIQFNN